MDLKRMKYFKGEFLTAEDFQCEQDYHRNTRLLHNTALHTPGIVSGLSVTAGSGSVMIGKGVAIDRQGRELVLNQTLPVSVTSVVSIAIKYVETDDSATSEGGFTGVKRATPGVALCQESDPDAVILAKVTNASTSPVTLDQSQRVYAGPVAPGDLTVGQDLTVNGNFKVQGETTFVKIERTQGNVILGDEDNDTVTIEGSLVTGHSSGKLRINAPVDMAGALTLPINGLTAGNGQLALANGNVGIGTASPADSLHLHDPSGNNTLRLSISSGAYSNSIAFYEGGTRQATLIARGSGITGGPPSALNIYTNVSGAPITLGTATGEKVRIADNGNIGIGTAAASEKLEVNGTIKATAFVGDGSRLTGVSTGGAQWTQGTGGAIYYNGGNVGIGAAIPKNRLDVEGGAVVGASLSGTSTAPANGLLVEGNVGIGTATPKNRLDVEGGAVIGASLSGASTAPANGLLVVGNVGIGTANPKAKLEVAGGALYVSQDKDRIEIDPWVGSNGSAIAFIEDGAQKANLYWHKVSKQFLVNSAGASNTVINLNGGNVGIGDSTPTSKLSVAGSIAGGETATGWVLGKGAAANPDNYLRLTTKQGGSTYHDLAVNAFWAAGAKRFDLAEVTPVREEDKLEAGDAVVIDETYGFRVTRSRKPQDASVYGVVSNYQQASMVIGGEDPVSASKAKDKLPIALAGRVKAKVSAENGAIKAGDLLTTSSSPGYLMKCENPSRFTGAIAGKALETLESGKGKIMILVTLL